jgi:uncharacterized cupin superfamily protein
VNSPHEVKQAAQIKHSKDSTNEFEPFPLDDVIEGDPQSKVHWLRTEGSTDAALMSGIFTAQPSRFNYAFETDETIHLIEGRVTITLDSGEAVTVTAGDIVSFPRGARAVWDVQEPLREFFVLSG